MKVKIIGLLLLAAVSIHAQPAAAPPPTFVRGNMNIQFGDKADDYALDLNVCNSCEFHGNVRATHYIPASWGGYGSETPLGITYDLDCDIINPHNPSQTKNVGQILGKVSVNGDGVYNYQNGSLECSIIPMGEAPGMDSKFQGTASGKPLKRPSNWDWHSLSQAEVSISRIIGGKVSTVTLHKYDQMKFDNCILCAGPMASYQQVTVNGLMLYDYEKKTWFMKDLSVDYQVGNEMKRDRINGNIRWMPDAQRAQNGLGEYDFNITVNEPMPTEEQAFNAAPSDESSFFQSDTTMPGVSGTWKYKDTITPNTISADNPDGDVTQSAVIIDMEGNLLTKQEMMVLFKLLVLSSIVPMNNG